MKYKSFSIVTVIAVLFLLFACEKNDPFSPNAPGAGSTGSEEELKGGNGRGQVRVMTWNVYVGADVDAILTADPENIPNVVGGAFAALNATDFNLRAVAIVDQIAEYQPHLIGLQEISLIRLQSPGDFIIGGTVLATDVVFDYLDILMAELASRGLDYEVAAKVQNADVELPMLNPITGSQIPDDVRLTDYDVVLVRGGIAYDNVAEVNYGTYLSVEVPGMPPINILRGYASVDATIGQVTYRFVSTHLESYSEEIEFFRLAQAGELLGDLSSVTLPVIMVGDFNSPAPNNQTYNFLTAEFEDAWLHNVLPNEGEGFTAPHDYDLLNTTVNLNRRIDLVLVRTPNPHPGSKPIGPVQATVIGDELQDRTAGGMWPSDHAGVVAKLHIQAPAQLATSNSAASAY